MKFKEIQLMEISLFYKKKKMKKSSNTIAY